MVNNIIIIIIILKKLISVSKNSKILVDTYQNFFVSWLVEKNQVFIKNGTWIKLNRRKN